MNTFNVEIVIRFLLLGSTLFAIHRCALPRYLEALVSGALFLATVAGATRAYHVVWWLDDVAHAVVTPAVAIAAGLAVLNRFVVRFRDSGRVVSDVALLPTMGAVIGVAAGTVWELYEWLVIQLGVKGVSASYGDTLLDLIEGGAGAFLGGLIISLIARRSLPSSQRSMALDEESAAAE